MRVSNLKYLGWFAGTSLIALVVATPARVSSADSRLVASTMVPATTATTATTDPVVQPPIAPTLPPAVVKASLVFGSRSLTVTLPLDGRVEGETAKTLTYFFRDPRNGRQRAMAPDVLALLADLAREYPGRTIEVVSGVRTYPNGAKHSKHYVGRAIDLRIPGVKTTELRDYLWRTHHGIGLGHYTHKNFVHLDVRPNENDCAWSGKAEGGKNSYHPRWAKLARQASR